jgi:hypothetical protein
LSGDTARVAVHDKLVDIPLNAYGGSFTASSLKPRVSIIEGLAEHFVSGASKAAGPDPSSKDGLDARVLRGVNGDLWHVLSCDSGANRIVIDEVHRVTLSASDASDRLVVLWGVEVKPLLVSGFCHIPNLPIVDQVAIVPGREV